MLFFAVAPEQVRIYIVLTVIVPTFSSDFYRPPFVKMRRLSYNIRNGLMCLASAAALTYATSLSAQIEALRDSSEISDTATTVESYSPQTWSDGCLGLGGPAEACLAALTEGWQVILVDADTGDRYTYRTNQDGSTVRRDEDAPPMSN